MPVARKQSQTPDPYLRIPEFEIRAGKHKGGIIQEGTWFKFRNGEERFKFKYHVVTPSGSEFLSAWGGLPPRGARDNNAYAWRSFDLDAEIIPI